MSPITGTTPVHLVPAPEWEVLQERLAALQAENSALYERIARPQATPLSDDIDRARFAAELLRDRMEVLVSYGPEALSDYCGTDEARALNAVIDELTDVDSEMRLVRHTL